MLEACTWLGAHGVEVVAAAPPGFLYDRLRAAGIPTHTLDSVQPARRGVRMLKSAVRLTRTPASLSQILRVVKPDIIHANSFTALLAMMGVRSKIPLVWHVRDLRLSQIALYQATKRADMIVAASRSIDEWLAEVISPRIMGRVRVIRNGIDLARFANPNRAEARARLGLPEDALVVGMVAHLAPWKRHDAFIKAAAEIARQVPRVRFVAAGQDILGVQGKWVAKLKEMVVQSGLSSVLQWEESCSNSALILPAFDLLLHPAVDEPFGRVICEAMATGVPVVAVRSGGPMHILEDGVSGLLVKDGNPANLAQAAIALLSGDAGYRERMVAKAREVVKSEFSISRMCAQLVVAYKDLLFNQA